MTWPVIGPKHWTELFGANFYQVGRSIFRGWIYKPRTKEDYQSQARTEIRRDQWRRREKGMD